MSLHIIVLAAGQGKRMRSILPKVMQPIAGKPMLQRVVETASLLQPDGIHVIYGHGGERIQQALSDMPVHWVLQAEQLGTGHAVMQALPYIPAGSQVLVLSGDVPLIAVDTLQALLMQFRNEWQNRPTLGLLVTTVDDPTGLGRILRDETRRIAAIVEEKDASSQQRAIQEVYTGICCAAVDDLQRWLPSLSNSNAQGEYYLTEIIAMAKREETSIVSFQTTDAMGVFGANNFAELQMIERVFQQRQAKQLMLSGVRLADAARIDIRGELTCGQDVFIDVNAVFEGQVHLGDGCVIAPNCLLKNVTIGANCVIHANSVLENCHLEDGCHIGPFARLRPGTRLAARCKIGNFVEIKNVVFGENSKASHLSYIGDATVGRDVNIGAGTITCNYDGVNKHQTILEDGVFVGSDTQFVAPVRVGKNATIGAGSTIRKNVPAEELTLTASVQKTVSGWKRPVKKEPTK
jgi:bifunctional UDP-N-acetylglucosamine pyrophosphorylase/glucosamine-1-phosphate N-acetyltransferase